MNIHVTITQTERALSRAKAALTTLGRLGTHREHLVSLQRLINELEETLYRLRHEARHPKVAA